MIESGNERFERFASIVSHDLRNPLSVTDSQQGGARFEITGTELVDQTKTPPDH